MTVNSDWLVRYMRVLGWIRGCSSGDGGSKKKKSGAAQGAADAAEEEEEVRVSACFDHGCIVVACVSMCVHVNRVECLDELPCG